MKGKYKVICMSFDGEYQTERPEFESIDAAWEYDNDLGSKWYFYPFHFIVTASGKTIKDAPAALHHVRGYSVKKVAAIFKAASENPDNANLDPESFIFAI